MTAKEILKNFPIPAKDGVCENCAYIDMCDKILPGFNKPNKCGGPFDKPYPFAYETARTHNHNNKIEI